MPIHDWSLVGAGLFHDFHHAWVEELKRALNAKILPPDYYAMAEQYAAGFGPDVRTLQHKRSSAPPPGWSPSGTNPGEGHVALAEPRLAVAGETEM